MWPCYHLGILRFLPYVKNIVIEGCFYIWKWQVHYKIKIFVLFCLKQWTILNISTHLMHYFLICNSIVLRSFVGQKWRWKHSIFSILFHLGLKFLHIIIQIRVFDCTYLNEIHCNIKKIVLKTYVVRYTLILVENTKD